MLAHPIPITEVYSSISLPNGASLDLELDIYRASAAAKAPAVVFFHGGALTNYSKAQLPDWLLHATLERNAVFISANYRLLVPCSLHDIIADVQAVFVHLRRDPSLDWDNIIVCGSSAGALLASYAAMHVPALRPKGYLSLMGLGGQHFTPEHLVSQPRSFYFDCADFDQHLLAPAILERYFPTFRPDACWSQEPVQEWQPDALWEGKPSTLYAQRHPRAFLMRVWQRLQDSEKGTSEMLDVLLGRRTVLKDLTAEDKGCFPMLATAKQLENWPPSLFIHGTDDQIVLPEDSKALCGLIASHHPTSPSHAQLELVPGGMHDGDSPSLHWNAAIERTEAWLDERWRDESASSTATWARLPDPLRWLWRSMRV